VATSAGAVQTAGRKNLLFVDKKKQKNFIRLRRVGQGSHGMSSGNE
jgi:hypothetical protein